jgi:alpha-1,6-mannosyltransferase
VKLTPSRRLDLLGVVMLTALALWARYRARDGAPLFLIPLAVAGVAYLLTIRELSQTPSFARPVVLGCLALSFLWRVPFFPIPAGPQDDLHRYVWDGRVQRFGHNPYTTVPADPALAGLHAAETG